MRYPRVLKGGKGGGQRENKNGRDGVVLGADGAMRLCDTRNNDDNDDNNNDNHHDIDHDHDNHKTHYVW